jgi:hypothetical protein
MDFELKTGTGFDPKTGTDFHPTTNMDVEPKYEHGSQFLDEQKPHLNQDRLFAKKNVKYH